METLKLTLFAVCVFGLSFVAIRALLAVEEHQCEPLTADFELMHYYNASFGTSVYKFVDNGKNIGSVQTERKLKVGEMYTIIITKPE
jgi:hypothetical protein